MLKVILGITIVSIILLIAVVIVIALIMRFVGGVANSDPSDVGVTAVKS